MISLIKCSNNIFTQKDNNTAKIQDNNTAKIQNRQILDNEYAENQGLQIQNQQLKQQNEKLELQQQDLLDNIANNIQNIEQILAENNKTVINDEKKNFTNGNKTNAGLRQDLIQAGLQLINQGEFNIQKIYNIYEQQQELCEFRNTTVFNNNLPNLIQKQQNTPKQYIDERKAHLERGIVQCKPFLNQIRSESTTFQKIRREKKINNLNYVPLNNLNLSINEQINLPIEQQQQVQQQNSKKSIFFNKFAKIFK